MTEQCRVCFEVPKFPVQLKCEHTFCFICAKFVKENTGCCPLCRDKITEQFNKFSISDLNAQTPIQNSYPCIKWLFGSRDERSWWYYDDEVSMQIEHYYQNWNSQYSDSESSDESDSEISHELPKIYIGPREYTIDFGEMRQFGNMRSRKILRKEFANMQEKEDFDKTIRGIVGIYFQKK